MEYEHNQTIRERERERERGILQNDTVWGQNAHRDIKFGLVEI